MDQWPLWLNALVFCGAASVIWFAGTRLERLADRISRRTGLGQAFTGMLLLAAATSLPEVATTVTAIAVLGNPTLAVHNLLGGVAFQTAILAIADVVKPRQGALTFFSPRFVLLIEGVGLLLLLQITVAGVMTRGVPVIFSTSLWLVLLLVAYVALMYFVYRYRGQPRWTPARSDDMPRELQDESDAPRDEPANERRLGTLWLFFGGLSAVVLTGGWFATQTAENLAEQTGLGSAFLGATLLAAATSLPELSTTMTAVRNDRHTVAVSNVFGSNAFDVCLLLLADLLYRDGTILAHAESSVVFVAVIGAIMTCIFLWGLLEHENRTILRFGWDSGAVLLVFAGGVTVLYFIQ
jgi:cation:H+ antiporter